ncbi:hypothetical protein [Granulicella tundricola]|uniref:hypothetical protein n=1 Tax=Granulicella tundricola TaxID=940615 RepID=UPI0012F8B586|nr:hypothetical protein [Granulicella tundricola]
MAQHENALPAVSRPVLDEAVDFYRNRNPEGPGLPLRAGMAKIKRLIESRCSRSNFLLSFFCGMGCIHCNLLFLISAEVRDAEKYRCLL